MSCRATTALSARASSAASSGPSRWSATGKLATGWPASRFSSEWICSWLREARGHPPGEGGTRLMALAALGQGPQPGGRGQFGRDQRPDGGREAGDGGVVEKMADRKREAEGRVEARHHLRGAQRVPAELEEIVAGAELAPAQHLAPRVGNDAFDARPRGHVARGFGGD